MLKVTKCIGVKSFVEASINMVCELKITSGCKKKMFKNFMEIRHSIKELLAKMHGYAADEMHRRGLKNTFI